MPYLSFCCTVIVLFSNVIISVINTAEAGTVFAKLYANSLKLATYEQKLEDVNAVHKIKDHIVRQLIVLPLTDSFKPNRADVMYGKIEHGDKCSLPMSLGHLVYGKKLEVPWIFEMKPVKHLSARGEQRNRVEGLKAQLKLFSPNRVGPGEDSCVASRSSVEKVYISPLDFRAPENYIYVPSWVMEELDLKVFDTVEISFVRLKLADLVTLQPVTSDWDTLVKENEGDPKVLLEHELNKYSSLTASTTISIKLKHKVYPIFVKEIRAEGGASVKAVRVQDSDIRVDIDRGLLDKKLVRNE